MKRWCKAFDEAAYSVRSVSQPTRGTKRHQRCDGQPFPFPKESLRASPPPAHAGTMPKLYCARPPPPPPLRDTHRKKASQNATCRLLVTSHRPRAHRHPHVLRRRLGVQGGREAGGGAGARCPSRLQVPQPTLLFSHRRLRALRRVPSCAALRPAPPSHCSRPDATAARVPGEPAGYPGRFREFSTPLKWDASTHGAAQVNIGTHKTDSGADFYAINPKGARATTSPRAAVTPDTVATRNNLVTAALVTAGQATFRRWCSTTARCSTRTWRC